MKTLFSDKTKVDNGNIILIDKEMVLTEENEVAERLNNYFTEAVENIGITPHLYPNDDDENSNDIYIILNKYRQHPSITKIKEYA